MVFNEKDELQHDVLRARGVAVPPRDTGSPPRPTSSRRSGSASAGGAVPEPQLAPDLGAGRLVTARRPRGHVDVQLHWQRWRIDSPMLTRLADVVRAAAAAGLRR